MARTLFSTLSVCFVVSLFSNALGGPACSKKYSSSEECMKLCMPSKINNWGFKSATDDTGLFLGKSCRGMHDQIKELQYRNGSVGYRA